MRIAVVSGVAGNLEALRAALDALPDRGVDRVVVLGELAGGPCAIEVLRTLEKRGIAAVRGPADAALARSGALGSKLREALAGLPDHRRLELEHHVVILTSELLRAPPAPEPARVREAEAHHLERSTGRPKRAGSAPSADASDDGVARALLAAHEGAAVVAAATAGPAFVYAAGDRLSVGLPFAGVPLTGDPRAAFAVVALEADRAPRAQIVREPWDVRRHVRATRRAVKKGRLDPQRADEHLAALLGRPPALPRAPLAASDAGSGLLVKLLAHRIHDVYAVALKPWPDDSVEHVHDLRVATRRFREALALASAMLPRKDVRRVNRRARNLGRALGARRSADVFRIDLRAYAEEKKLPGTALFELDDVLRQRATEATTEIQRRYPREKLLRHGLFALSLSMMPRDEATTLGDLAKEHLLERVQRVEPKLDAIADATAVEAHHELRIALKHLRYSAEMLSEAYPRRIVAEETITPLKALQDALGELNDVQELLILARAHASPRDTSLVVDLEARAIALYEQARGLVNGSGRAVVALLAGAAADLA